MGRFVFDKKMAGFKEVTGTFGNAIVLVVQYFLFSVVLAALYYAVFSLFVSTDVEKRLHSENKMYEKVYAEMRQREKLISETIDGLQVKDNEIYRQLFYNEAPGLDPVNNTDFLMPGDTVPDRDIVRYTSIKADALLNIADKVEADFLKIISVYSGKCDSLPPLSLPLDDIKYVQIGASVGERMNPYYKVPMEHKGVDIIAPQGSPVRAAASGKVVQVTRSRKGQGNVVSISHGSGYVTRYCHLGDLHVSQGQTVRKGARIAEVGLSGNSFAPHLHYELIRDSTFLDPVHYFFASVTPDDYANMVYMSVNTGQSMD